MENYGFSTVSSFPLFQISSRMEEVEQQPPTVTLNPSGIPGLLFNLTVSTKNVYNCDSNL